MFSPSVLQSTYKIWVRLEIPKNDYLKLKADAVQKLRDRFNQEGRENAKLRAERILEDLKKDI